MVKRIGKRRAVRAAPMRLPAVDSDMWYRVTRNPNREHGWVPPFGPHLAPIDGVDVTEQVGVALMVLPQQVAELREQRVIVQSFERMTLAHNLSITCFFEQLGSPSLVGAVRRRVARRGWRADAFLRRNRLGWRSGAPETLCECARRRLKGSSEILLECSTPAVPSRSFSLRWPRPGASELAGANTRRELS